MGNDVKVCDGDVCETHDGGSCSEGEAKEGQLDVEEPPWYVCVDVHI